MKDQRSRARRIKNTVIHPISMWIEHPTCVRINSESLAVFTLGLDYDRIITLLSLEWVQIN